MSAFAGKTSPTDSRRNLILAVALCALAGAWLVSRVFLGLDFTDEMQYYGEIASLVRTGKFFQTDLFLQQLGYLFVWPFFKLHAALFPDQNYLVLFGRLLFLGAYLAVGLVVWRESGRSGSFSRSQRILGLAAVFAWIPFQLFAFSYNSIAYLLIVALLAGRHRWSSAAIAIVLTALTYAYPPAGLAMIALGTYDRWHRGGARAAFALLGLTMAGGVATLVLLRGLHGADFFADLRLSMRFSRSFTGGAILQSDALATWVFLTAGSICFIARSRRSLPAVAVGLSHALRAALIVATIILLYLALIWPNGYYPGAAAAALLVVFGYTVSSSDRAPQRIALLAATATLLSISSRWGTGHFAATAFLAMLAVLASVPPSEADRDAREQVTVATVLGTVIAFTSSNGVHNFGVGAAPALPFLAMWCARETRAVQRPWLRGSLLLPQLIIFLTLVNAALYPYREQRVGRDFERMRGVPAFAGLWTSPMKVQAVATFQQLFSTAEVRGKRLLVAGPHPWLYFAAEAQPVSPMLFMHFTVREENYDLVAEHLYRGGPPDAVLVTNAVPRAIHARLNSWASAGCIGKSLTLPADFRQRYSSQTRQDFGAEVTLLQRVASP